MTTETYKKITEFIGDDNYTGHEQEAMWDAIREFRNVVWHDSGCEDPKEGKTVLVIGGKKIGLVRKFRSNGGGVGYDCKWAYVEDLLPSGIKMEDINV